MEWFDESQNLMQWRRGLDMQMVSISAHLNDAGEKRHLKHYKKEKLWSGFLFRKALCKIRNFSECRLMPRINRRNWYQHLKFNWGWIVAYREYRLSLGELALHSGWHPFTIMWISDQCVNGSHTEGHTCFQRPPLINGPLIRKWACLQHAQFPLMWHVDVCSMVTC